MPASHYVEVFRPAYPDCGVKIRAHRARGFVIDQTAPTLTALFEVAGARTADEAIALVVEHAAGHGVTVRRMIPAPIRKAV